MGVSFGHQSSKNTTKTNPTYNDPRAQQALDSLSGLSQGGGNNNVLAQFYQSQLTPGQNPYIQNVVSGSNTLADQTFKDRLAQVRSGGYRGGIGRDNINQGMFASDFTNRQFASNNQLFADQYNRDVGSAFQGASGLGGLDANMAQMAAVILAALRGQEGTQKGKVTQYGAEAKDLFGGIGALFGV